MKRSKNFFLATGISVMTLTLCGLIALALVMVGGLLFFYAAEETSPPTTPRTLVRAHLTRVAAPTQPPPKTEPADTNPTAETPSPPPTNPPSESSPMMTSTPSSLMPSPVSAEAAPETRSAGAAISTPANPNNPPSAPPAVAATVDTVGEPANTPTPMPETITATLMPTETPTSASNFEAVDVDAAAPPDFDSAEERQDDEDDQPEEEATPTLLEDGSTAMPTETPTNTTTPNPTLTSTPTSTPTMENTATATPSPSPTTTPQQGSINGQILLEGNPQAGVTLNLETQDYQVVAETRTDSAGEYSFSQLSSAEQYNVLFTQEQYSQHNTEEVISWGWLGPVAVSMGERTAVPPFEISLLDFEQLTPRANASYSAAALANGNPLVFEWSSYPNAEAYWVDLAQGEAMTVVWQSPLVDDSSVQFTGRLNDGSQIEPGNYWWGVGIRRDLGDYNLTIYGYLPPLRINQ